MDTLEQETPVGEAGATASPDTVSDETQPVESADSVSDGQVEETGSASETLLAGKYKSPQELEKAYLEAQKAIGESSRKAELANLLEKQTGMNADQLKEALTRQEQQRMEQAIAENPGLAAYQEVQNLKAQLALQNEEKELNDFISSEEGKAYQPFKDKILKLGLNLEKDKSYADIAREYFGEARATGQQDAYKKIETKKMTQATGASQSAPKSRLAPEDMDKMSADELATVLPWADTSDRLY